jgi:hypothetical protein
MLPEVLLTELFDHLLNIGSIRPKLLMAKKSPGSQGLN